MLETARKILIVDDEKGIRDSIYSLLEKRGFYVDEAASGEECFRKIKRTVRISLSLIINLMAKTALMY